MWVVVGALMAFSWLIFFVRARPLASTLDRGEVMVLKPLSITYLLLALALAISSAWVVAAVSAFAWLFNGAIGASLHKSRTFTELTEGTLQSMQKGPRAALSEPDSRLLASIFLRITMIFGAVLVVVLVHYGVQWYFALPAAVVAAWVFMVGSMFFVAYQKKPSSPRASSLAKLDRSLPDSPEPTLVFVEELACELSPDGVELWKRLLTMKLGDKKGARNLVLLEKKYKSDASMEVLIQAAIDRWIEDLNLR